MADTEVRVLSKGCVCGHDHETHRGEKVDLCLECSCDGEQMRCQNCGGAIDGWPPHDAAFHTCSRACLLQLEHAARLKGATS